MGSFEWYQYFPPKNQSWKLKKLGNFYCYDSNCRKLLILECSFMYCKLFILFMFVYEKNRDTFMNRVYVSVLSATCYLNWLNKFKFSSGNVGDRILIREQCCCKHWSTVNVWLLQMWGPKKHSPGHALNRKYLENVEGNPD